jgi:hypothetical protein
VCSKQNEEDLGGQFGKQKHGVGFGQSYNTDVGQNEKKNVPEAGGYVDKDTGERNDYEYQPNGCENSHSMRG